ncbi:glutamic-type intramembrane protease PrsW [Pseudobacillus badius]|uniref:glutamic-type intramembrane protease PrsW n=1 Tax=Bacillus badius TaxID=1455 RepID=UPI0007B08D8B|nr:glutamic-type intramembrane protease PrsW [Bacillus badius]KZN98953.1 protease [Bacillus badius]KZR60257.1 protease [Bacillus badius]MED0664884.1 glutamic-type intramembrane protease PrsW [Bacillus badius]OCS83889.1 protease [Bacillus badius]OVE52818.1 PrsW family intramembrane metalloprotease [Bacillus badius]
MLAVFSAGVAPGLALLCYFYLRDQYETEPVTTVAKAFIYGVLLTFPVMFIQYVLTEEKIVLSNVVSAFLMSGLLEEFVKWFILFYLIYQHMDFDEPYDGIVYGTSVSLGFATAENILYLLAYGVEHAFLRALLPVSSHALFGVLMGFYFGKAKFSRDGKKNRRLWISLAIPFFLHGLYDYILFIESAWLYYMVPFMLFLWWLALKKVKQAHKLSDQHYLRIVQDKSS